MTTIPSADPLAGTEAPPKKQKSLTNFQKELESWTKELRQHTAARNFLYQAFEGKVPLPMLTLSGPGVEAGINMRALPQEYANAIVQVLLEHEERNAIYAWECVYEIAHEARILIKRMQQDIEQRTAEDSEKPQPADNAFDEQPDTPEEQEQDARESKLGAIARDMLAEMNRGEPEPDQ